LEDKIQKAQAEVTSAKEKYEKALDELEKLLTKRRELENKALLEAFASSDRTLEEVIGFLKGVPSDED